MILFLNEDRAYRSWVAHHRQGYVLDGKCKPKIRQLVLHRATCALIKSVPSRRIGFTTGAKLKACAMNLQELQAWAEEQSGGAADCCPACRPESNDAAGEGGTPHPTRLQREILDYVLDAAVIHLEHEHPPYRLTIGDIAACFAKTPGQLAAALRQLVADGLLEIEASSRGALAPQRLVRPTRSALRTLEAFRNASDQTLKTELAKLDS